MSLIPADWLPESKARRIICHWTGGDYRASALDREHYHILIERDGNLVRGLHAISDNDSTADGKYAAHTLGTNTGSIGVSVCCMAGAQERPFQPGSRPMTEHQWDVMAEVVGELCRRYGIAVTPRTVLAHGEVQKNLGNRQRGKWDPLVLPWKTELAPSQVGDVFREHVVASMDEPVAAEQERTATLIAEIQGVVLPASSFNENAWLRVSDLVTLLGWTLVGADPKLVQLTTAEGAAISLAHCFADGDDLDPGLDAAACKEAVGDEGFIGAADLANVLGVPLTFLPDERRLVFSSAARPVPASAPPAAETVVIRSGDTLSAIAAEHLGDGKRWRELRIARPVTDADATRLRPGDVILLPDAGKPEAAPPVPAPVVETTTTQTVTTTVTTVTDEGAAVDVDILARTLWGEARGEKTRQAREAVAAVILNRVKRRNPRRFGGTIAGVCQKKFQFSCWNDGDPNRPKLLAVGESDPVYKECLDIARAAAAGTLQDATGGADHYHTISIRPSWARGRKPVATIGNHLFYNDIP